MAIGISSYNAKSLAQIQNQISDSSTRLTSGKKINSAKDDAAGLAIVSRLEAVSREFDTGIRNASDAMSVVEIADAAVGGVESGLQRLRELSIQSANGILSDQDRSAIAAEAEQIQSEIGRVVGGTDFNGKKVLSEDQTFNVQVGGGSENQFSFSTTGLKGQIEDLGLSNIDLSTQRGASDALAIIDGLLGVASTTRSEYGALSNRFESVVDNLSSRKTSVVASKSRFEDADVADEAAKLSRSKLLENASIAMQAQANASASSVLSLLQ